MEEEKKLTKVQIINYFNPHVFWLVEYGDLEVRKKIEDKLKKLLKKPEETSATIGKIVTVKEDVWKRAYIKNIDNKKIRCWLMDYGVSCLTEKVYDIPIQLLRQKSVVKQACLYNIVGTEMKINDLLQLEYIPSVNFNNGIIKCVREHLIQANDIFVKYVQSCNSIYQVEIFLNKENGESYNLIDTMIKENNFIRNEMLFKQCFSNFKLNYEMLESINCVNHVDVLKKSSLEEEEWICSPKVDLKSIPKQQAIREDKSSETNTNHLEKNISFQTDNSSTAVDLHKQNDNFKETDSPKNTKQEIVVPSQRLCIKNQCNCSNCLKWSSDSWFDEDNVYSDTKQKSRESYLKPAPFLKKTDVPQNCLIQTSAFNWHSQLATEYLPLVLVHGVQVPAPAKTVSDVPFHTDVLNSLHRLNIKDCKRIQSYTWPAIFRNLSVCAVGNQKCGKTMMYLPCIISLLLEERVFFKKSMYNKGPLVIIVCDGVKSAEKAYNMLMDLYQTVKKKSYVALAVPPLDKVCLDQFKNQCDILITTPIILRTLLARNIINLKRLCHIVFDNFDKIFNNFEEETIELLNLIQNMIEHRTNEAGVQFIITAEFWTKKLENIIKKFYSVPLICISAYLEAAIYGRVDFEIKLMNKQKKEAELINIVEELSKNFKTVVMCNDEKEVSEIVKCFNYKGISVNALKSSASRLEIKESQLRWLNIKSGEHNVLVCTDSIFENSSIRDAVILIHYSLPESWTVFTLRYKSMLDQYVSPYGIQNKENKYKSYIFVDENCQEKISRFIMFLQSVGITVPSKFLDFQKKLTIIKEEQKVLKKTPICKRIKLFGKCNKTNCHKRHIFNKEIDFVNTLPQSGIVNFKITSVCTSASYMIKLLENDEEDVDIEKKLNDSLKKFKLYAENIQAGSRYVYITNGQNKICEVLKILETHLITKLPSLLKIKLLYTGETLKVHDSELFEIPKGFENLPQEIEMYLVNMVPPFSDSTLSTYSTNVIKKIIDKHQGAIFTGNVLLQISNTLWMKNVRIIKNLPLCDETVTQFSLSREVKDKNILDYSDEPLSLLYCLCDAANIEVDKCEKKVDSNNYHTFLKQEKPNWAFLEEDVFEKVCLGYVVTSEQFFVYLEKHNNLLQNLEKDIERTVTNPLYIRLKEIIIGKYYVAKHPYADGYVRVKVTGLKENYVYCFCVDYGKEIVVYEPAIKSIQNYMITKLPFQAIECRLYGVTSVDNCVIQEYFTEDDALRPLYALSIKTENKVDFNSGYRYSIFLSDMQSDSCLNNNLIESDLAQPSKNEDVSSYYSYISSQAASNNVEYQEKSFSDYDDDDFDFYSATVEELKQELHESNKKETPRGIDDFPPIRALPSVDYCTPSVLWYQTNTTIIMNIQLPGLVDYSLVLLKSCVLIFNTTYEDKRYKLFLNLYGNVNKPIHSLESTHVKIMLTKKKPNEWPRLISSKERMRHIKYDMSRLELEDDEKERVFLDIGHHEDDKCISNFIEEYGSDTDYSISDMEENSSD